MGIFNFFKKNQEPAKFKSPEEYFAFKEKWIESKQNQENFDFELSKHLKIIQENLDIINKNKKHVYQFPYTSSQRLLFSYKIKYRLFNKNCPTYKRTKYRNSGQTN
ncbi:MAG: hypothetical protein QY317_16330 [Candidatus Jettenia caeni]|nr:MAG: hypothetical protein QY317_16330 [Candidatus Jettenia caeni]